MRWTTVLLAAALALGAAPATGADRADGMTQERRTAWLAERARLAERLPGVPSYDAAAAEDFGWYADLTDAGDFDGDGKGDFLDVRSHLTYDDATGFTEEVRLDAYRGFDGTALWTRSLPPAAFVFPIVTKVGADGKQGVLVVSLTDVDADVPVAGASAYDTTVTSYSGAGVPLWTRPLDGLWVGAVAGAAYADHFFAGVLDAVPGGGTDVLVHSVAVLPAVAPSGSIERATSQLGLLDGATGAVLPLGQPIRSDEIWGLDPRPVGDLDKDKRDDVLVEDRSRSGGRLTGVASGDGRTLWTTTAADPNAGSYVVLPDVTGDGKADFGSVGRSFGGIVVGPGGPGRPAPVTKSKAVLYDGATGKARWVKPGTTLFALGDVDHKGAAEVAVGAPAAAPYHGFTVGAYTGAGKRLWTSTRRIRGGDRSRSLVNSYGGSADLHGDGVNDVAYALVVDAGNRPKRDEGFIDGRTGRVTRDPRPDMYLTRAALDGRGADAYVVTEARGVLTFEAWRGDRPVRLWSLALRTRDTFLATSPGSVDGDRCGDIALATVGDGFTDIVVSGGTGKPLWTLSRSAGGPGTVGKPSVARHTVHRKGC